MSDPVASTTRPLRVLYFDHVATMSGGEIALLGLIQQLDRSRIEPIVLLGEEGPLADKLRECADVHILPLSAAVGKANKDGLGAGSLLKLGVVWSTLRYIAKLRSFLQTEKIDLVHANSLKSDLLGGLACRLAGTPILWHVRDRIEADYLPGAVVQFFRRAARHLPTAIIANSQATAATLQGATGRSKRLFVVHDGTDVESFRRQPATSSADGKLNVGLVGRISPWKGQEVFIQAAHQLRSLHPDARFKLIGAALFDEKDYEAELHRLVESLALNDIVEFKGFCNDIPGQIAQLDVLVHASTKAEPFGQVIIEGMAAGKAVVATAAGGVLEIVQDGVTGLLVPMGDDKAMAEAIGQLLFSEDLRHRLGAAAQRHVAEHFSIQKTALGVADVYANLLPATVEKLERSSALHHGRRREPSFAEAVALQPTPVAKEEQGVYVQDSSR